MEEPWTRTGSAKSHWEVTEASTRLGLIFCFQMFQGQNLADQAGFFWVAHPDGWQWSRMAWFFGARGTVPKCAKSPDLSRLEADPAKSIQNLLRLYHHPQPQPCFIFFHFTLDDSPILFWNHIIYGATGRSERLVSSRLPSCCFASLFWWPNLANHILHGLHSHISYSISPFVEMFSQQNHHLFCIAAWHTSTGANFFIVSWTKSMAGSHLPYLALALGTCSKWPCVFFLLELAASLVTFLLQYQVVLYIYIYIHIYIYLHMYYVGRTDRIWKTSRSQIEYGKKPKNLRPQTADRICKQHMQIEYEHMIYVQCCMCVQYSTALPAASTV